MELLISLLGISPVLLFLGVIWYFLFRGPCAPGRKREGLRPMEYLEQALEATRQHDDRLEDILGQSLRRNEKSGAEGQ